MDYTALINEHLKAAMLGGDKLRLETLRSLRAGIIEFEKNGSGKSLGDEEFLKIVNMAVKKRKDAIEQYKNVGRSELMEKEQQELAVLMEFMPQQLGEDEVRGIIAGIITDMGASSAVDFGKVMGVAMKSLKGKADGGLIQTIVKEMLS
ncbi:MAG: GatB/YqeY domain-containing protein [Candidatus Kapabacteria bacterium]|nr:GatB/YqeY domain-containing protein [Candidatus Kapabacteria bacterium]